ncbi:kinesin-like protein KIF23 [Centruroides sculpturatus]|uniref:kinesin-like protein KIF23 n=1 Tax=Centruroides sculpturatus TaxID=218467 RepID=UPI000C6E69BF|nr:kinesin-like protein KIF23 [Centruroides sculpturatus]
MKPTRHKTPKRQLKLRNGLVDPVEVYCRLRTLEDQTDDICVKALDNCTVKLMQRDGNTLTKNGLTKEIHYTFKYVFDENVSQKTLFDNIAFPLVEDLIRGKNGLLFTYGITSSGKTYTMTGTPQDGGLLPRCLDAVFNSVGEYLTRKYIFKPDKLNGFDVQSIAESLMDLQKDLGLITPKTPKTKKKDGDLDWSQRIPDDVKILEVDSDNGYAVFVSYIEIYNNYIYDLLEDIPIDPIKPKPPQSKILREDANHNMYVFGMTEKEVKTADEAFELFCKGQRRRRVAHTALNTESSRSHSVFNVRLVQAPLDPVGAEIIQDRNQTIVSQLSLVDLAGSERTVRTRNTGDRLREAGNINTSLMALRECIEILRENQNQNSCKLVPYRKSKLTHLFKNYFEGEGKVRMVVCINPRVDDYDEIIHVMRFAELAQEVLLSRPTPLSNVLSSGLKSGRGNNYREAVKKAEEEGTNLDDYLASTVYTMGPAFPIIENMNSETLTNLLNFMNDRKVRRETLLKDLNNKQSEFRRQLSENEKEMMTLRQQVRVLQMDLEAREQQVKCLEKKISDMKETNDVLNKKIGETERNKQALENELDEKEMLLNKGQMEKEKIKSELHDRLEIERSRMQRIMVRGDRDGVPEIMDEIVTSARNLELEVNEDDIEELIMKSETDLTDRNQTIVSQLSLVDLAGSERTVRTRNTGDRLREAGNINTSLMALRECIEILRENQNQNSCKLVPYRKSKLTHLFKNYFEGEGKVRMVVCINPRVDDYDEIIHVMRFAELAQEVLLSRPTPLSNVLSSGLKSGRGNNYREAVKKAEEEGTNLDDYLASTVYTMGPAFPIIENMNSETLTNLLNFMNDRKVRRETLLKDLNNKQSEFRRQLSENEKEMMTLRQQVRVLQMDLEAREQQVKCLEKKISDMKETNDVLNKKIGETERNKQALENELDEKEMLLNKGQMEKEKIKSELHDRLEIERSRMQRIMASRLAEKQAELEAKMCMSKEKFKQLREILNSGDWEEHLENLRTPTYTSSSSEPRIYQVFSDGANTKKS